MDERLNVPRWEGQAAYITPCIRNYVNGPTGMLYNPGTALSPEWKDHFFVVEFIGSPANSGIHAFTLKPKGASFAFNEGRKILGGVLPTGLDWGPDGAMYAGDWIEGWGTKDYGRIWKLEDPRGSEWAARKDAERWIKKDISGESEDQLYSLLAHEDMRVRQKAQFEVVKKGDDGYQLFNKAILPDNAQLRRVHGIFGIAQMARTQKLEYAQALVSLFQDEDAEIRAQAAKWLGDVRYDAGPELTALLGDTATRVRFFAAEALGRIAYAPAQEELIRLLIDNDDQDAYIRHAGSLALARIDDGERLAQLANHPSRALRIAAVIALRRMENKAIANFINDEDVLVVREVARGINDDWSIEEALDELGAILNTTFKEDEVIIRRSINANLRVGSSQALQRVLDYALNSEHPTELRSEALATIRHWHSPSVLDRVDGRYRGEITRDLEAIQPVITKGIASLLKDEKSAIIKDAAYAAGQNKLTSVASQLKDMLSNAEYASVRRAALESLVLMEVDELPAILSAALSDKDLIVRVAALDASGKVGLPPEEELSLYRSVVFDKTISERQSAIAALGKLPAKIVAPTFNELLEEWSQQSLDTKVRLDVAEAITELNDPTLNQKLSVVQGEDDQSDVMAAYIDCLSGGDPGRGGRIIWNHTGAQCIRCHQMHDYGGIAGPPLTHIGDELTPKQLLESLVLPGARIAPGYGMVSLIMKDGSEIDGMLIKEEGDQLTIRDAEDNMINVDRQQIDERIDALSGMTDMTKILTKREIRDVVAYLTTLKKSPG
ncbi:MAG: c-type cytochrome [Saprospiraceae bacterium]|nr:c-type cytochrome [Saprospiraceae bacterium]